MNYSNKLFEISLTIPIIFVFLFICYRKQYVDFMNSILGKLTVCILIIYYTLIDKIYGLFACALFVLFYQLDTTIWLKEGFFDTCPCSSSSSNTSSSSKEKEWVLNNKILNENELQDKLKSDFQKKHCSINGELMYKDLPVKTSMSSIIYPQIKYENEYNVCNLCDKNCQYKVIN